MTAPTIVSATEYVPKKIRVKRFRTSIYMNLTLSDGTTREKVYCAETKKDAKQVLKDAIGKPFGYVASLTRYHSEETEFSISEIVGSTLTKQEAIDTCFKEKLKELEDEIAHIKKLHENETNPAS